MTQRTGHRGYITAMQYLEMNPAYKSSFPAVGAWQCIEQPFEVAGVVRERMDRYPPTRRDRTPSGKAASFGPRSTPCSSCFERDNGCWRITASGN